MANSLYSKGREAFLGGGINFSSDTINMALVASSYSPDLTTDQSYSDISSAVIGTQALSGKAVTSGVADCSDVTFPSVSSGTLVKFLAIYKDTGVPSSSTLIALFDTATGLPFTTTGADVIVTIDNGVNRLFRL